MKKFSAIFTMVMGILMIIVWVVWMALGLHDFTIEPFAKVSLLAAQAAAAASLIVGGIGILNRAKWGPTVHITSYGMMLYTAVTSIGVFAQLKIIPAVIFFILLSIASVVILWRWATGKIQRNVMEPE